MSTGDGSAMALARMRERIVELESENKRLQDRLTKTFDDAAFAVAATTSGGVVVV